MRRLIIGVALALAACANEPNSGDAPVENAALPTSSTEAAAPESNASAPTPAAGNDSVETAGTIPVAFHGRWGLVPGDCTSIRGDAKGLLVIDAGELRFYESRAVPRDLKVTGPDEWTAILDYMGEGQTWSERTTVTLLDGGKGLRRMADGPWTYQRCEA